MDDEHFEAQESVRRYSLTDVAYFAATSVAPAAMTIGGGALSIYGLLTKNSALAVAGSVMSASGIGLFIGFGSLDDYIEKSQDDYISRSQS